MTKQTGNPHALGEVQMEKPKYRYTVVIALQGTFMHTTVEANNTAEAMQKVLRDNERYWDSSNEIVSITITERVNPNNHFERV